jgi:cytohesin
MKDKLAILCFASLALVSNAPRADAPIGMTDSGSPNFAAIERLLDETTEEARRQVMQAIWTLDRYAHKASPSADELVITGRAYVRAMGNAGAWRAGELASRALRLDAKHGGAHLLLAEIAAYAACSACVEEAIGNARAAGVDEASLAAMEGFAFRLRAMAEGRDRAVGEAPPLERAIAAYERAAQLEKRPARLAADRAALFELERRAGNPAKAIEHAEAVLGTGYAGESFLSQYASFLLYERDEVERAATLAAQAAGARASDEVFAMVLFRLWADKYLANPNDRSLVATLESAKGANRDFGAIYAASLASTATLPVAKALLRAGLVKADTPGMRDSQGNTPLANAVAGARADRMREQGAYGEPLSDAQYEIVEMLLKRGANPNAFIEGWNQTVLGHAAARGDLRVVKLLLKHGANVQARMGDGATALAEAAQAENAVQADAVAAILLARNVPVAAANRRGETALHAAARNGNTALIERLLKAGADPMAKDNSGWRPLEMATSSGKKDAVRLLLAAGAQVSPVVNACGSTSALDIARRSEDRELIELLRSHAKQGT